jgi:hypothetical protein
MIDDDFFPELQSLKPVETLELRIEDSHTTVKAVVDLYQAGAISQATALQAMEAVLPHDYVLAEQRDHWSSRSFFLLCELDRKPEVDEVPINPIPGYLQRLKLLWIQAALKELAEKVFSDEISYFAAEEVIGQLTTDYFAQPLTLNGELADKVGEFLSGVRFGARLTPLAHSYCRGIRNLYLKGECPRSEALELLTKYLCRQGNPATDVVTWVEGFLRASIMPKQIVAYLQSLQQAS